jgi:hypothetical protein
VSDCYSEISASESNSEEAQDGESCEILVKDGNVFILVFFTMGQIYPMVLLT